MVDKKAKKGPVTKVSRAELTARLVDRVRARCPRLKAKLGASSTNLEEPSGAAGSVARCSRTFSLFETPSGALGVLDT